MVTPQSDKLIFIKYLSFLSFVLFLLPFASVSSISHSRSDLISKITLQFDGLPLNPDSTPEEHDMENGDIIEVNMK